MTKTLHFLLSFIIRVISADGVSYETPKINIRLIITETYIILFYNILLFLSYRNLLHTKYWINICKRNYSNKVEGRFKYLKRKYPNDKNTPFISVTKTVYEKDREELRHRKS